MYVGDCWVVLNRAIVIVWRSVALLLRRLLLATTATTADCYTNYFCDECKTSCPHPLTGNLIAWVEVRVAVQESIPRSKTLRKANMKSLKLITSKTVQFSR